ncbi:hypothetical protein E1264_11655 [Actinomadura sp. KC216]|uniref:hypothetical protein n=1 Tax=Actinomadura sp. KC216 TaxID=2530370 RepID=UPI00104CE95C|nr:hypothetical protein [Actinomadura sp. KC216]TDB88333.1 hypothetical protein E1264_11655 [Actinomadura sp. KC216]
MTTYTPACLARLPSVMDFEFWSGNVGAAPLGVAALLSLVGAGRCLGLVTGLGCESAVKVRFSRLIADTLIAATLSFAVWKFYFRDGFLDLNQIGVLGFSLRLSYPYSLALFPAMLVIVAVFANKERRAAANFPRAHEFDGSQVVARRSIIHPTKFHTRRRTLEEWLISEGKDVVELFIDVIFGRLRSELLKNSREEFDRITERLRQSRSGSVEAASEIDITQSSASPHPASSTLIMWCLTLWVLPHWWPLLDPLAAHPLIAALGQGAPESALGRLAVSISSGTAWIAALALACALPMCFMGRIHILVRPVLLALSAASMCVAVAPFIFRTNTPLWDMVMPLPLALVSAKLTFSEKARLHSTDYPMSKPRTSQLMPNGSGTGLLTVIGITLLVARQSFQGSLKEAALWLTVYAAVAAIVILVAEFVIDTATLSLGSNLSDLPPMIGIWAGVLASPMFLFYGERYGSNDATIYDFNKLPEEVTTPLPSTWWCMPMLVTAGYVAGTALAYAGLAGRWKPTHLHADRA